MTLPIELPKETLDALRKALPHGAIEEIATVAVFSRNYVSMVLHGECKLNENNIKIIYAAQKIIRDAKSNSIDLAAQINKTLTESVENFKVKA